MKRIFTLITILLFSLTAFGQGKLVKSSSKSQPKWINRNVDKYDIIKVSATSTIDLETARQAAFDKLKSDVITASIRYIISISIDANESKIKNQVENSQYLKDISEGTSIETYWEERYKKRGKTTHYNYYILYNFNDFEIKKMALEIDKNNSATSEAVNNLQ